MIKTLLVAALSLAATIGATQAAPYTLFIYEDAAQLDLRPQTTEAAGAYWSAYDLYGKALADAGVLRGGSALSTDKAIALVSAGAELPSSGSFYSASQLALGGYFQIEVADEAAAIAWAKHLPALGTAVVEVRAGYPALPRRSPSRTGNLRGDTHSQQGSSVQLWSSIVVF